RIIASFSLSYIPMAPGTALANILLGSSLLLLAYADSSRFSKFYAVIDALLVFFFSFITFMRTFIDFFPDIEDIFLVKHEIFGEVTLGHMSPLTAASLILISFAMLLLVSAKRRKQNIAAGVLACISSFISIFIIIGYFYGMPFHYSGKIIPMALTTAIALLFLGVGTINYVGTDYFPLKLLAGSSARARLMRAFLPVAAAVVIIDGAIYNMLPAGIKINYALFSALSALAVMVFTGILISRTALAIGSAMDKAERDRGLAEDALASEKERLSVTLRSISEGVIATDKEEKVVLINKAAGKLTGWSFEESSGRKLMEIFNIVEAKSRAGYDDPVKEAMTTKKIIEISADNLVISRNGTERIIEGSIAPILDRESKTIGAVVVFRDITEKEEFKKEVLKMEKLESLGILASGIAHDFKNLLTPIVGTISLLKASVNGESKVFELLDDTEKASRRANDLIEQLMTFSKGGTLVKSTASIAEIIKESTLFILSGSRAKCEFNIPGDLWHADVDKTQISQVIQNIIINADHAMPEGGIIKIIAENIYLKENYNLPLEDGKYVKVSVQDSGIGIPQENLARIFDPYFTTKSVGGGLGLAVSYSITKKHGGHITVESKQGEGTTFYIYFPASEKILTGKKDGEEEILFGKGRILIMDDEEMIRNVVGRMLNKLGYEFELANNGAEAVEKYNNAMESGILFDAVIMDLTIPGGMGGEEAVKKLKEINPGIKAIVSSGYSNDPIISNFKEYGFSGVVNKPYTIQELSRVLYEVINR
ncbi:MAG: ATP-binding protein, partial [Firmicutes bacterium]|nr:ATP-binding protein [Bacillota bacterium]